MKSTDLARFTDQIARIERANLSQEQSSKKLTPLHAQRQPVHVMYGGAHLFKVDFLAKISKLAQASFQVAASDGLELKALLREDWTPEFTKDVFARVTAKMEREVLEDYRIDFEDGYGFRTDEEEDAHAIAAADALVAASKAKQIPAYMGIRVKPLSVVCMKRSLRTLSLFVCEWVRCGGQHSGLKNLTVTLPKVTNAIQVDALVEILQTLETEHSLAHGFFNVELLIESPEAVFGYDGKVSLPILIAAARGRCTSLHFGVYDFTASLGVGSAGQSLKHASCDFARFFMLVAGGLAPGLNLSDGIINVLPIAPHKKTSSPLTEIQEQENYKAISTAWRINYEQMTRSLQNGFYQGWDLHPSQTPIRHVANHVYVLKEFPAAVSRLKGFAEKSAQANRVGSLFDDRASVLGLVHFVERAISSKIIEEFELNQYGLNIEMIRSLI